MKTNDMLHRVAESRLDMERMVLPDDEKHPLLNRQIVYTGITRAKKRAVIVGNEGALTSGGLCASLSGSEETSCNAVVFTARYSSKAFVFVEVWMSIEYKIIYSHPNLNFYGIILAL